MTTQTAMKASIVGLCATLVAGCAGLPDWSLFGPLQSGPAASAEGAYNFSWRLSGDRQAGPIQVFDDGRSTWLQFGQHQAIPAIFARTEKADRLLTHRVQGPYVVVDGVWPVLILRAGALQSQAQRVRSQEAMSVSDYDASSETSSDAPVALSVTEPVQLPAHETLPLAEHPGTSPGADSTELPAPLPLGDAVLGSTFSSQESPIPSYGVSPADGNIRLALSRWARSAGWTFEAEHWAVDVDIPIAGTAVFNLEFDEAVQQLLAATELSERPLQPCFYANKVLRIVSYTQSCDRSAPLERA